MLVKVKVKMKMSKCLRMRLKFRDLYLLIYTCTGHHLKLGLEIAER